MSDPLRLVFLGTKDFAWPSFVELAESRHRLLALVTQPDRPQGRKQALIPARIKLEAEERGIRVFQPEDLNLESGIGLLKELGPDLIVTVAYGQILSPEVLSIPRLGGINLHGSILPKYRGAAPVARAIERGETETGVTVIQMSPRVDAGGVVAVRPTPIDPDETAGELEARLGRLGAPLLMEVVESLSRGPVAVLPQDGTLATRAPKLRKDDGRIDWKQPARAIHDLVRAMQPWPIASTAWIVGDGEPKPLIVHRTEVRSGAGEPGVVLEGEKGELIVGTGDGLIRMVDVQTPGKRAMSAAEFLRGHAFCQGTRFLG